MRYKHNLLKLYFNTILFFLPFILFGQNEAIIVGKVVNPQGRTITFRHRNNPLLYDENTLNTNLDADNNFFIRIKSKTSQTIYMDYQDKKFKFFLSPGDTLKINFDDKLAADKAKLEGSAAANNNYLLKTNAVFPDWLDESLMANQRKKLLPVDYQIYVDSVYRLKRRFFDNYPITDINNFSSEFLDFSAQDIHYWRAFMLMKYYDDYHSTAEISRSIDDNYFNFLVEIQTSSAGALNNDYCLKFLSLYLNFLKDKYFTTTSRDILTVVERRVVTQTVRPVLGNVRVLLDPFTSKEIVGWMSPPNRAEYLNLRTDEKFRYIGTDTTFEDTFLKIKTEEGRVGWVPASSVVMIDNVSIVKDYVARHCFDTQSPVCGLEKYLSGRVLYLVAAKEVLLDFLNEERQEAENKLKAYTTANTQFLDYNDFLNSALTQTYDKRKSGYSGLGYTPICLLSDVQSENTTTLNDANTSEVKYKILNIPNVFESSPEPPTKNNNAAAKTKFDKNVTSVNSQINIPKTKSDTMTNSFAIIPNYHSNTTGIAPVKTISENNILDGNEKQKPQENKTSQTGNVALTKNAKQTPETEKIKQIVTTKSISTTETKPVTKVNMLPVVEENNTSANIPTIDFSESNKKFFKSDAVIDEAGLNLHQELVRSNPNEKEEPIKKFEGLVLGEEAPKYKFTDLQGKEVASEDLLGKVVFIEFWATWCGPCQMQMAHAQELAKNFKDRDDVVFVFISKDEDNAAWKLSLKDNKWKEGSHGNDPVILPLNFGVQFLPNSFIIDKKGKVSFNSLISKRSNVTDEKTIDALVKSQR